MPPVNTPAVASPTTRSPTSPQSPAHNRPLTPLSYLSSPVPDLASTLYTQAADEADEANVSFLRESVDSLDQASQPARQSQVDPQRDPRRTSQHQPSQAGAHAAVSSIGEESAEDRSRRERLQRVLSRLNRLHEPAASSTAAYSNRTPSPHRQSLYDWAPSFDEHGQEANELDAVLEDLRRQQPDTHPDMLRLLSQTQLGGQRQEPPQREGNGTPAPVGSAGSADRRERLRERERRRRENEWASLRTRAAIQRSRQEGSPSATDRMLRYVMQRERSGMSEEEERARGSGWFRPSPSRVGNDEHRNTALSRESWLLPPPASDADRDRQERVEAFRRGYLAENVPPRLPRISTPTAAIPTPSALSSSSSPFLESALNYLSDLRSNSRYEEALSTAIDHGLATKEFFADKHDDFIMDLEAMDPLAHSSWLQPGTVFDGHQYATSGCGSSGLTHHGFPPSGSGSVTHAVEQINPNYGSRATTTGFDHPPGSTRVTPFDATRPWLSHQFTPPTLHPLATSKHASPPQHDQWPVRVTLHSVDAETKTLHGTMEAYDVPQHPASLSILSSTDRPKAGKKGSPIITYVEGHIIDLRTHSFLTPSPPDGKKTGPHQTSPRNATPYTTHPSTIAFPAAGASIDAANWRQLPPFNQERTDDEAARLLLSQARMQEVNEQYIFMRWKERCFIHTKDDKCDQVDRNSDQDRGHGLTISGFYYISLCRADGMVEGLYFDPTSTPYQHLRLAGKQSGWPAFELK